MSEELVSYEPDTSVFVLEKAKRLVVNNEQTYIVAGDFKADLKHDLKEREDYFEPLREKAYSAYQEVLDKKKKVCEPYKTANVLEDQLIGIDVAYFSKVIEILRDVKDEKITSKYLNTIIDRVFSQASESEEII